jgi:antitoxin component YwqK of YwqJK toxin-antitoxin module|tara:strand:+ start:424 stop:834 length:411 start_codon:yes stop_codon:yes gene_type:complete
MKYILIIFFILPLFSFAQHKVILNYYDNGNILSQVHYADDLRDGSCRNYYINATLMDEGFYINGKMSGLWISYYNNGNIKEKGKYSHKNNNVSSFKTGTWTTYYQSGEISSKSKIVNGKENRKHYNKEGELLPNDC